MASNYPNGFEHGLLLKGVPVEIPHPGKVFWVNNSSVLPEKGLAGSNGNDGTYLRPFASVDYAIGKCTAGRGDVIYVMPGHVEDITAAQGVDFDVEGVKCIGLGHGDQQARFDMTNAAGDVTVDADNVHIYNMNFHANVTSITIGLSILTGATDCVIKGCRFDVETTTTDEFLISINVGVGCDRLRVEDCNIDMGLGGAAVGIKLVGATAGVDIRRCRIVGDYSLANIDGITTLSTEVYIEDNLLINGGSGNINTVACIILLTGTTGAIRNNHLVCNLSTPDLSVVADTMIMFNNLYSETITGAAEPLYADKMPDDANNYIGVNDANNVASTSNVVANRDGSLLERSEFVMDNMPHGFAVASIDLSAASPRTCFTIAGGPILIHMLAIKITANCSANAALFNFSSVPTVGSETPISKVATAPDLASAVAGDWFAIAGGSAEVAVKYATGTALPDIQSAVSGGIVVDAGTITAVMSTNDLTTGTATAYMAFTPMAPGVTVS